MLSRDKLSPDELAVVNNELYKIFQGISRLSAYILDNAEPAAQASPATEPIGKFVDPAFSSSDSLAHVTVANYVRRDMPIAEFMQRCADAYSGWPALSSKTGADFNVRLFGASVKDCLFKDNETGWNAYKEAVIKIGFGRFTA